MTRNIGNRSRLARSGVLLLLTLLLIPFITGCGTTGQTAPTTLSSQPTKSLQATEPPSSPQSAAPSPSPSSLHGPTNFLFTLPLNFSSVNGATTDDNGNVIPLDAQKVKDEITGELKRMLFVVNTSDNVEVYSPGVSPLKAQVTFNNDGTTAIDYTQTVDSEAGTISITFVGTLHDNQMTVEYQQQYTPSMMINANASGVDVTFSAGVRWVPANQIPAAPTNGAYQIESDGGIAIKWSTAQNAVAYDVYRLISDQDQQFQFLTTVQNTPYVDDSPQARQNVQSAKGITYAIFSVGSTGVENPGGLVIPIGTS